jgi:hypothetical protein
VLEQPVKIKAKTTNIPKVPQRLSIATPSGKV